ncbi:MAG: hypothetical protein HY821_01195 [Acidobacteria bacterium]|nr:hypothetical protein [Acidobacteriota bacterium]
MRTFLLLLLPLLAAADDAPRLFYSKSFPGSKPAYMEIRLLRDGSAEYREAPQEDDPIVFKLSQPETDTVFELSNKLDHFQRELESGLKVARMGDKTMRWEKGAEMHQVKFNYTMDADGTALYDWFEKMCESALLYIELERTAKYDKLGVNQAILHLEAAWDRHRLVGREQYLKLLDRIANNESYINMARERAEKLAAAFRSTSSQTEKAGEKPDGTKQ